MSIANGYCQLVTPESLRGNDQVVFDFDDIHRSQTRLLAVDLGSPEFNQTLLKSSAFRGALQAAHWPGLRVVTISYALETDISDDMVRRYDDLRTVLNHGVLWKFLHGGGDISRTRYYQVVPSAEPRLLTGGQMELFFLGRMHVMWELAVSFQCQPDALAKTVPVGAPVLGA